MDGLRNGLAGTESRASLNNPSVPLSSDSIVAILGTGFTTDSGVNVGETNAMRFTAVYRAVQVIAGTIAGLPLNVFEDTPDTIDRTRVPVQVLQQPYPDLTSYEFWELILTHLLLWGNAFCLKVYNELGDQVVRLMPLLPFDVQPMRQLLPNGTAYGPKVYAMSTRVGGGYLTDEEILHFPGLGYDGIKGLSPIAMCRQSIGLGIAAEEAAARLYGSGSLLGGVLQTEQRLEQPQADAIKLRWRERVAGLARAHEIAVLDAGLKFVPVSIPPEQAQFLQSRQFQLGEVARIYGVPPHLLMDLDKTSSWGQGVAEQSLGFIRYTLSFWLKRLEGRLNFGVLPANQHAEFDFQGLLRGDTAARYAAYNAALAGGWMNANEVRAAEGLAKGPAELDAFNQSIAPLKAPASLDVSGKIPKGV
jgi:HK97 family phage portal protein